MPNKVEWIGKIIEINSNYVCVKFEIKKIPKIGTILKTKDKSILVVEGVKDNTTIIALVLKDNNDIFISNKVISKNQKIMIPVGQNIKGRMFDFVGELIDDKGQVPNAKIVEVKKTLNKKTNFQYSKNNLETGIKIIDFFTPIAKTNKIGFFGGAGVGKTLLSKEIMNNLVLKNPEKNSCFIVGIGERNREGQEIYVDIMNSPIKNNAIFYFAQMNTTASARKHVIYTALTAAEYMSNIEKEDVLFFIDNIYRFVQAGSEVSSSLGVIPSRLGYQPTLETEIANIEERLANSHEQTITSFQTVFVPNDDISDPANIAIFSHLDCAIVLDRNIMAQGRFPTIDPLKSFSNNISIKQIGTKHYYLLGKVKRYLQKYYDFKEYLNIFGFDGIDQEKKQIILIAQQLENYFTQNFFCAEQYNQRAGVFVTKEQLINEIDDIVSGKYLNYSPHNFLYLNSLEELNFSEPKNKNS